MTKRVNIISRVPVLGPMYRRFVAGYAPTLRHILTKTHTPTVGEPVWFASKQIEGEITWVPPDAQTFVFGTGTPRKPHLRFRYSTTVYTNDVVYDETLHAWIVGQGPIPDHLLRGTVIRPDPVEVRLITRGRH
jgi:hypothetical protein